MRHLLPALLLLTACDLPPEPLPTEQQAAEADAQMQLAAGPPLVQLLYDYAFLPEVQYREQRVRILIWLQHMELGDYQLRALRELWDSARLERARIERDQARAVAEYEPRLAAAYDGLWTDLSAGAPLDDPKLEQHAQALSELRLEHERSEALLELRLEGVQAVLEAERPWLATLSPSKRPFSRTRSS